MVLKTIQSSEADKNWNQRLKGNKFATIHQTHEYVEYVKLARNQPSYYITFENRGEVVGQLALHRLSRAERKIKSKLSNIPKLYMISKLFSNLKPIYVWDYGPIIFKNDFRDEIFSEILKFPKKFKAPIKGSLHPLSNPTEQLIKNGWKEKRMGTFLIDLTLPEDQLWHNIDHHSGRKAVNRAMKKGVIINPIRDINDLKIHHSLLNEGKKMAQLPEYPFESLEFSWRMLNKVGQSGFIAWLDDRPLASTLVTTFNGYLNEWGFAESKYDRDNLLSGSDVIKWHLIKWGQKSNFRIFDLSGVELDPSNKKERGIFNFKKKWGGALTECYNYTFTP